MRVVPLGVMSQEILSLAVFEPLEGNEEKALEAIRGLMALLAEKKYSDDVLYRDQNSSRYMVVRRWTSEEARQDAHEDPDVHIFWARLGHLIKTEKIYESYQKLS